LHIPINDKFAFVIVAGFHGPKSVKVKKSKFKSLKMTIL